LAAIDQSISNNHILPGSYRTDYTLHYNFHGLSYPNDLILLRTFSPAVINKTTAVTLKSFYIINPPNGVYILSNSVQSTKKVHRF